VQALQSAGAHLQAAAAHLDAPHPALDLLAEELRLSHRALGEITGEFTSEDLLGEIFGKFCIGK
jgi:tRNA modification GTPase